MDNLHLEVFNAYVVILICPKFHVMTLEIGFEIPEKQAKKKKKSASSVNRTRASSMATTNSTTRPTMLLVSSAVLFSPINNQHSLFGEIHSLYSIVTRSLLVLRRLSLA